MHRPGVHLVPFIKTPPLAVTFISLGKGVIYSSDPGVPGEQPHPGARVGEGSVTEGTGWSRPRGGQESRCGGVSWETQTGKGVSREQLIPTEGHRGSLWPFLALGGEGGSSCSWYFLWEEAGEFGGVGA